MVSEHPLPSLFSDRSSCTRHVWGDDLRTIAVILVACHSDSWTGDATTAVGFRVLFTTSANPTFFPFVRRKDRIPWVPMRRHSVTKVRKVSFLSLLNTR